MKRRLLLALACAAMAARAGADTILTVGTGGTHATVQSAIDEAVSGSDAYEIHVAVGRWRERVTVFTGVGRVIKISGGWVDGFSRRTDDPTVQTVLDGEALGTVLTIVTGGHVSLAGFVITGGLAGRSAAGGVFLSARGGAIELFGNTIRENRVTSAESVSGGGLVAGASRGGRLSIRDNLFERNAAVSTAGMATHGGANISGGDGSFVEVVGNRFFDNEVRSPELAMVSALNVSAWDSAQVNVDLNLFRDNRAIGGRFGAFTALRLQAGGTAGTGSRLFARRNQVLGNPTESPGQQVEMHAHGKGAVLLLGDSVVARGSGGGITTNIGDGATVHLTNLTVTDHPQYGVATFGDPPHVTNTILFDDGTALQGTVLASHNLQDVDPQFVDPAADDYRLSFGSPAVDAGDNGAPFLGTLDVYGGTRIANGVVDVGADESPAASEGSTPCLILSSSVFVDRSAPACTCLSDAGLRQTRCGFFVPDFFLVMLAPFPLPPDPAPVTWTIHPWMPMGGPYQMKAEARIDGQWVAQDWLGPVAQGLKDGQPVVEPFKIAPARTGRTPFRTTLQYLRPDEQSLSSLTMEILLPASEMKK
jgi:hypothetical protein